MKHALLSTSSLLLALLLAGCEGARAQEKSPLPTTRTAINGMSVAHSGGRGRGGYGSDACIEQFEILKSLGVNYVALNNFAWMGSVNEPNLRFAADRTLGEGDTGKAIDDAHAHGLKVFLKPHIWAREFGGGGGGGKWHGDIAMTTEHDWDIFFQDYTDYIVHCAKVAQETHTELFCVGVEYVGTSKQTQRWHQVIAAVRKVYSGRVTYSAAFTEWKDIEFWDALDVISVAAYFPLTDKDAAPEADIRAGWSRVYAELDPLARRTGKTILFSELGYTPDIKAAREPWSYEVRNRDETYQALLYRIALEEAAKRPFVEGIFLWKWMSSGTVTRPTTTPSSTRPSTRPRPNNTFSFSGGWGGGDPFSIQNKPLTLQVIKSTWPPK